MIENQLNMVGNKIRFILDYFNISDIDQDLIKKIEKEYFQIDILKKNFFFEPNRYD